MWFHNENNVFPVTCRSAPEKPKVAGKMPLTGDPEADADIMAFMKARQRVRKGNEC